MEEHAKHGYCPAKTQRLRLVEQLHAQQKANLSELSHGLRSDLDLVAVHLITIHTGWHFSMALADIFSVGSPERLSLRKRVGQNTPLTLTLSLSHLSQEKRLRKEQYGSLCCLFCVC